MKLESTRSGWRLPPSQPTAAVRPFAVTATGTTATALKASVIFALVSMTLLDRFGVRLSDTYSISPGMIALYVLLVAMVLTRSAELNPVGGLAFVGVITVAGLSFVLNVTLDTHQVVSLSSLMLLLVIYLPTVLSLRPGVGNTAMWQWVMKWYVGFAACLAVAGILQFYIQFVFRAPWLFDYTSLIPPAIRGSGLYNTTNPVGSLIKSNGFVLREASGFSAFMALALVCEWSLKRRKFILGLFAWGLVVCYSGSGLLALGVAMLFPLGQRTLVRVAGCVAIGAIVVVMFGDALNLTYTINRVGEFESSKSSAYCRFIAPGKLVAEQIDSSSWTTWIGHGPGTTQKMSSVCETTYGKVLFEYGLLGALAIGAMVLVAVNRSAIPVRIRIVLLVQWLLLGGNLLAPDMMLLLYLISGMWPRQAAQEAASPMVIK
jgi:hypothetical protein